jgi:UDP-N-acetylmuramoyl-tripeptide--D-alanyl-D-alanine ligase
MSKLKSVYEIYKHSLGVNTDSRSLQKGEVFFALKGGNFNGNKFAKAAINQGAKAVICDEEQDFSHHKLFIVKDSLQFLQELANYHRNQCKATFIGITGSNGKTTTKELLRDVLSTTFSTQATKGNFNNHIGVPLTLLEIKPDTEIAIIEMGANHQKEIEALCKIAEPDYGYITNFGKAHLEGFGGVEGVIKGKSELYNYLEQNNRKALLNFDDSIQKSKAEHLTNKSFGFKNKADYIFEDTTNEHVSFSINGTQINTKLIGDYNLTNVCSAVSFGLWFGADLVDIKSACENYVSDMNRSELVITDTNKLIMDAYNANPTSMALSISNFKKSNLENKLMILGDMFELGKYSKNEHKAISELAKETGIDTFFVGESFAKCAYSKSKSFNTTTELLEYLEQAKILNRTVLLKGSRSMGLEKAKKYL